MKKVKKRLKSGGRFVFLNTNQSPKMYVNWEDEQIYYGVSVNQWQMLKSTFLILIAQKNPA